VFNEHKECLLRTDEHGHRLLIAQAVARSCRHLFIRPVSGPRPNRHCP